MITIKSFKILKNIFAINDDEYDTNFIDYSKHIPFISLFHNPNYNYDLPYDLESNKEAQNSNISEWLLDDNSFKKYRMFTVQNYYWGSFDRENYNTTFLHRNKKNIYIGGYSLFVKTNITNYQLYKCYCLLCVKPEYIYYVKLCILTNTPIEFDCFYLLVENNIDKINSYQKRKAMLFINKIVKELKGFDTEIIYCDIDSTIYRSIEKPKTNTIGEYNKWLDNIKLKPTEVMLDKMLQGSGVIKNELLVEL